MGNTEGDYNVTFDAKINSMDRKTSTASLPPSYSDLNLDSRNSAIQMTKFSMRNSGVGTIPENEPRYDVISDVRYQNMLMNGAAMQQQQDVGAGMSKTPPLPQQHGHDRRPMVTGMVPNRAQSHNVIPTYPVGEEKKVSYTSSSSDNVGVRTSRIAENNNHALSPSSSQPWYRSSTPSVAATSPTHQIVVSPTPASATLPQEVSIFQPANSKVSTLPGSNSHPSAGQLSTAPPLI